MKKFVVTVLSVAFASGVLFFSACTEDDTSKPTITITNNTDAYNRVEQFGAAYTDPGATANDVQDGDISCTASVIVNMNQAGEYDIIYSATDKAGNTTTATRTVTVDGGLFLAGTYSVEDFVGAVSQGTYTDNITASSITWNKINFTKFGFYQNAAVFGTIANATITIPSQTVTCGLPPNDKAHTFSGSGTFTNINPLVFTITFHDSSTDGEFDCHDVYTIN